MNVFVVSVALGSVAGASVATLSGLADEPSGGTTENMTSSPSAGKLAEGVATADRRVNVSSAGRKFVSPPEIGTNSIMLSLAGMVKLKSGPKLH